ncbi:MAG: YaiO family outer membrane beta-barrel protein [Cyclobacteriaceae bacterium]
MKKLISFFSLLFLPLFSLFAQSSSDKLYLHAQESASEGKYEQARASLDSLLDEYGDNYDALFMMALIQSWDEQYQEALHILHYLDRHFAPTADVKEAKARVYFWYGDQAQALKAVEDGLNYFPDNLELRFIMAQVLISDKKYKESVAILEEILAFNEGHEGARMLLDQVRTLSLENAISLEYTHARFTNSFSPWHLTGISYRRNLPSGPIIGRLQHAQMFDRQGVQAEVDAYPTLGKSTYAFLNVGVSDNSIFPAFRWGAELYRILPQSWEVSAGMRGLYFELVPVHVYTAQLGRYLDRYWFSLRGFATTIEDKRKLTGLLSMRHYLKNDDHFMSLYLGSGATPLKVSNIAEVQRLSANWIGFDYQHPLQERRWLLRGSVEFQQEEYEEIRTTERFSTTLHLQRRF